jgi:hypothetical protein
MVMMIYWGRKRNQGKTEAGCGIDSGQGTQAVANNVRRFVPLVASLSAVAIKIVVNMSLFFLISSVAKGSVQSFANSVESIYAEYCRRGGQIG